MLSSNCDNNSNVYFRVVIIMLENGFVSNFVWRSKKQSNCPEIQIQSHFPESTLRKKKRKSKK